MDKAGYYKTKEAAKLTGVSAYSLQNWDYRGFARPSVDFGPGRGMGKRYSLRDLIGLRAIRALLEAGVSLQRVKKLAEALRDLKGSRRDLDALAASRLVVAQDGTVAVMDRQEVIEVLSRQTVIHDFVNVDLKPVVEEMLQVVGDYEAAKKKAA